MRGRPRFRPLSVLCTRLPDRKNTLGWKTFAERKIATPDLLVSHASFFLADTTHATTLQFVLPRTSAARFVFSEPSLKSSAEDAAQEAMYLVPY